MPTVDVLVGQSLNQAAAGADIIAPFQTMMDGRIGAIREALEEGGRINVQVSAPTRRNTRLPSTAPFRDAVGSRGLLQGNKEDLPDGPGQRRGSAPRGRARHRRGQPTA
jgi:porphobilinogen synthase